MGSVSLLKDSPESEEGGAAAADDASGDRARGRLVEAFGVPWRAWLAFSAAVLVITVLQLLLAEDVAVGSNERFSLAVVALVSGWAGARGLVHWRERKIDIPGSLSGFPSVVLLVAVILPLLAWGTAHLDASAFWVGEWERLVLVMVAFGAFVGFGRLIRLAREATTFGAVVVMFVLLSSDNQASLASMERVSTATTTQLTHARDAATPILLRGFDHDRAVRVDDYRPAGAPGTCREVDFADEPRTLLGFRGRSLHLAFDACWSRAGEPISLTVAGTHRRGYGVDTVRGIRLSPVSADDLFSGRIAPATDDDGDDTAATPGDRSAAGAGTVARMAYGDTATDLATDRLDPRADPVKLRDGKGLLRDDRNARNDTVLARVSDDGDVISVVVAYERRDGVIARSAVKDRDWQPDRLAGTRPGPGRAIDVVTATLRRTGRSTVTLTRSTASKTKRR